MRTSNLFKNKKVLYDIILIGTLLLISLLAFLLFTSNETGAYVIVRINGEDCGHYSLSDSGIYDLNGGTNILVIEDGKAYLKDANCPDKLCVKQGKISNNGQCITCLPNKLTVTVYGGDSDVDFVIG